MAIGDLFRPKHKHSSAEVRAEAVSAMGAEDLDALAEVAAQDSDDEIRKLAVERISDPDLLSMISARLQDCAVGQLARRRAVELWLSEITNAADGREALALLARIDEQWALAEVVSRASQPVVRSAALDRLTDDRALASVVRNSSNSDDWRTALRRIAECDVLRAIAVDEPRKEVATAALDRIDDCDVLDWVASKAKNKSVRGRAKKRRAAIQTDPAAAGVAVDKRNRAERVQLLRTVEKHAGGNNWLRVHDEVRAAVDRWSALGDGDDDELMARFAKAKKRFFELYEREARIAESRARRDRAEDDAGTSATVDVGEPAGADRAPEVAAEETGEMEPNTSGGNDGRDAAKSGAHSQGEGRHADNEDFQENARRLTELCERLEALAATERFKGCERTLKQADQKRRAIGRLPRDVSRALSERYDEAHRRAVIRIGELREADDWKRWANVPKFEELIARAEALLAAAGEEARLAVKLKDLQRDWKLLGAAPHEKNEELWGKFKGICDQIYEQVAVLRKEQSHARTENLRLKEALCVKAEELSASTDWENTAEALKALQGEWKAVGPVPRRKGDALWKRFRSACDQFFEQRRPHVEEQLAELSENLEAKREILAKIDALVAPDVDIDEALRELHHLQREWRRVGHVPRREFGPLRDRYRDACEAVERRRVELAERERSERAAAVEAVRRSVDDLVGQVQGGEASDALVAQALKVRSDLLQVDVAPEEIADAWQSIEELMVRLVEANAPAFSGTELDPETSKKRKLKICCRIEELLPDDADAVPAAEQTAEQMAARLRMALADNALGGVLSKTGGRPLTEIVEEARESWSRLGPVPGPEGAELEARFARACERAAHASS